MAAGLLALAVTQVGFAVEPNAPPELQPPPGNELYLAAEAQGTQNYICLPSPAGVAWTFLGPQATLFLPISLPGRYVYHQVATHFLSPNPAEQGLARPTWQNSSDTSAVWGRVIASVSEPVIIGEGNIPWLLLQTAGAVAGTEGNAGFAQTTYIQRLQTFGGVAPATGCAVTEDIGHTVYMWYKARYFFYRAPLD
jgi:hypothetical protein